MALHLLRSRTTIFSLRAAGLLLVSLAPLASIAINAAADTFEWTNPVTAQYNNAAAWTRTSGTGSAPPDGDDLAVFNEPGVYSVNYTVNVATDEMRFDAGDVTLRSIGADRSHKTTAGVLLEGGDLTLGVANDALELLIGDQLRVRGGSQMEIAHGSVVNVGGQLRVGANAAGDGSITIDGQGSAIFANSSSATLVGSSGSTGTLTFLQEGHGHLQNDLNIAVSAVAGTSGKVELFNQTTLDIDGDLRLATSSGSNQSAQFNVQVNADVTLGGDLLIGTGTGSNQQAVLNMQSGGSTFQQTGAGAITVGGAAGAGRTARLEINGGVFTGGTGAVTIRETGVVNASLSTTTLGGPVTIENGGTLSIGQATFIANAGIDNSLGGSLTLGNGTLTLGGGFSLLTPIVTTFEDYTFSGTAPGARPKLIVQSGAEVQVADDLNFGDGGFAADLEVRSGGVVRSAGGSLARGAGSDATVLITGADSVWFSRVAPGGSGFILLAIGEDGTAHVEVADGGRLDTAARLGLNASGSGVVDVHGPGSRLTGNSMRVGVAGQGHLMIHDSATADPTFLTVGGDAAATSDGLLEVYDGGEVSVLGTVAVGGELGSNSGGSGTLLVGTVAGGSGTFIAESTLEIYAPGIVILRGNDSLLVAETIDHTRGGFFSMLSGGTLQVEAFMGNLNNQSGILAPGPDEGATFITGSYTQQGNATLEIDIGGTAPGGTYDQVSATAAVSLDGDLELSLTNGFIPAPTDTFTILGGSSLSGFFDNVFSGQRLEVEALEGSFQVNYGLGSAFPTNQVVLSAFLPAGLPGDFDNDGDVDGRDFLMWQRGGSPNGVSSGDLDLWQSQYGSPLTSNASAVPEPTSWVLMLLSMLGWKFANWRRRQELLDA